MQRLLYEKFFGIIGHDQHTFPLALLLLFVFRELFFFDDNIIFSRQPTQSLDIRQLFVFHNEIHRIPAFPASEAFINTLRRGDRKRTCFFIMKRTTAHIIHPSLLQTYKVGNHFVNICSIENLLYRRLINHSTKVRGKKEKGKR